MFFNISNQNSTNWSQKQLDAAKRWGSIVDIEFTNVSANADEETVFDIAANINERLENLNEEDCVYVMGESGVTWYIVDFVLNVLNYTDCVYPTFENNEFVQFRHYGGQFRNEKSEKNN